MNSLAHNDSLNLPFYQPLYRCISKTFACTLVYKLQQHTKKLQEREVCCVGRTASVSSLTKRVHTALHVDCALYCASVGATQNGSPWKWRLTVWSLLVVICTTMCTVIRNTSFNPQNVNLFLFFVGSQNELRLCMCSSNKWLAFCCTQIVFSVRYERIVAFNVYGSVHRNNILIYIQQDVTLHSLFYLETALHFSGHTTTHHQERKQLYLQHLVFVTTLLLSAAIVEELEPVWVCCGWGRPITILVATCYQNNYTHSHVVPK
jgi:hypothetical protein